MNWYIKTSQLDHPMRQIAENLPVINQWKGMQLSPIGSSSNSIESSLYDWEELRGIREIPYSMFSNTSLSAKNNKEIAYLQQLAQQILRNQSIEPLIVVFDNDPSPYVLEGSHRFDALLHYMGASTIPALVLLEWTPAMNKQILSSFRGKSKISQSIRYEFIHEESDDNISQQAYKLALDSPVNILSDKELAVVAISGNQVVGALFTSMISDSYGFDVIVHPSYQRTGIGGRLTDMAISEYKNMLFDMPDLRMEVDVVNPVMQKMLTDRGLRGRQKIDNDRSIMGGLNRKQGYILT